MKAIKRIVCILEGNINEAKEYIDCAYKHKLLCPEIAEWELDMAKTHLDFNNHGHQIAADIINETERTAKTDESMKFMLEIWQEKHGELQKQTSELKYLIEQF